MKCIKDSFNHMFMGLLAILLLVPVSTLAADLEKLQEKAYLAMVIADGKRNEGNAQEAAELYKTAALHYQDLLKLAPKHSPQLIQYLITYCEDQRFALHSGDIDTSSQQKAVLAGLKTEGPDRASINITPSVSNTNRYEQLVRSYENKLNFLRDELSQAEKAAVQRTQEWQASREELETQISDLEDDKRRWQSREQYFNDRLKKEEIDLVNAQNAIEELKAQMATLQASPSRQQDKTPKAPEQLSKTEKRHARELAELKKSFDKIQDTQLDAIAALEKRNKSLAEIQAKQLKTIESLRSKNKALGESQSQPDKTIAMLEGRITSLTTAQAKHLKTIESLKGQNKVLAESRTQPDESDASLEKKINSLTDEMAQQQKAMASLKDRNRSLEDTTAKQLKNIAALEKQNQSYANVQDRHLKSIASLEESLALAGKNTPSMSVELTSLRAKIKSLQNEKEALAIRIENNISELQQRLSEVTESSEVQNISAREKLADLSGQLEQRTEDLAATQTEVSTLEKQLKVQKDDFNQQLKEQTALREEALKELKSLQKDFSKSQKQVAAELKQAQSSKEEILQEKEAAVKDAQERFERLEQQYTQAEQTIEAQAKQAKAMNEKWERANKTLSDSTVELEKARSEISTLKNLVAKTQQEVSDKLNEEKESHHHQLELLKKKIKGYGKLEDEHKKSSQVTSKLKDQVDRLQEQLSQEKEKAARDTATAETAYSTLEKKLKQQEAEWAAREKESLKTIKEEASKLSTALDAVKDIQEQRDRINEQYVLSQKNAGESLAKLEDRMQAQAVSIKSMEKLVREQEEQLEESRKGLERQAQQRQDIEKAAETRHQDSLKARQDLNDRIKKQTDELKVLSKYIKTQDKLLEEQEEEATRRGKAQEAALTKSARRIEALEDELQTLEQELGSVRDDRATREKELQKTIKELEQELSQQKSDYAQLIKEKDAARSKANSRIKSLENQVDKSKRDKLALERLETEQVAMEKRMNTLQSKLASNEESSALAAKEAQQALERAHQQLLDLNDDYAVIREQNNKRATQLQNFARRIPDMLKMINSQAGEIASLRSQVRIDDTLPPGKNDLAIARKQLKAAEAENKVLKSHIRMLQDSGDLPKILENPAKTAK